MTNDLKQLEQQQREIAEHIAKLKEPVWDNPFEMFKTRTFVAQYQTPSLMVNHKKMRETRKAIDTLLLLRAQEGVEQAKDGKCQDIIALNKDSFNETHLLINEEPFLLNKTTLSPCFKEGYAQKAIDTIGQERVLECFKFFLQMKEG